LVAVVPSSLYPKYKVESDSVTVLTFLASSSDDGKLVTSLPSTLNTFNYDVTLTKDSTVLKSSKSYVDVVDKASQFASIQSFEVSKPYKDSSAKKHQILKSNTAVVGEKINIVNLKATNKNGTTVEIDDLTGKSVDVKSSNEGVISSDRTAAGTRQYLLMLHLPYQINNLRCTH